MAISSMSQAQIYAVKLTSEMMNKFPGRNFKLKKLTEMGSNPEHFVITGKGRYLRKKVMEGISKRENSGFSATLLVWKEDEETKKVIASVVNELNKNSLIKFRIDYK